MPALFFPRVQAAKGRDASTTGPRGERKKINAETLTRRGSTRRRARASPRCGAGLGFALPAGGRDAAGPAEECSEVVRCDDSLFVVVANAVVAADEGHVDGRWSRQRMTGRCEVAVRRPRTCVVVENGEVTVFVPSDATTVGSGLVHCPQPPAAFHDPPGRHLQHLQHLQ